MPPRFALQPHEIAYNFAPVAPQSARVCEWGGRSFAYAVGRLDYGRPDYSALWLCEIGRETHGHWIVASTEPPFAPLQIEAQTAKSAPPLAPIRAALSGEGVTALARFVASPLEGGPQYALLLPGGSGCWFSYGRTAAFDFNDDGFIEHSSRAAWEWLRGELEMPRESVTFANGWMRLNAAGKVEELCGADWIATMQSVMQKALYLAPEVLMWNGTVEWMVNSQPSKTQCVGWGAGGSLSLDHTPLIRMWNRWLGAQFQTQLEARAQQAGRSHYRCLDTFGGDTILRVENRQPPSYHQILEAKLWLRDWMRERAAPYDIAALVPES